MIAHCAREGCHIRHNRISRQSQVTSHVGSRAAVGQVVELFGIWATTCDWANRRLARPHPVSAVDRIGYQCHTQPTQERTMAITITVNGQEHSLEVEPEMPLLWALREQLGLTGTKFGCGISACGACTVHLDGRPVRSCTLPVSIADGKSVTTIEGLAAERHAPQGAAGVDRSPGATVRLLSVGHDHGRRRAARGARDADGRGHRFRRSRTSAAAAHSPASGTRFTSWRRAKERRHEQVEQARLHRRRHHRRRRLPRRSGRLHVCAGQAHAGRRRCGRQGPADDVDHGDPGQHGHDPRSRTARWDRARRQRWR